jgi:group I intron endonuclease
MKMTKKYHFVYITTNLINGKQYVGDHSTNILETDNYLGSGKPYFLRALNEYGVKNFKREILEFFPTKQESFNAQEKYIQKYNTLIPLGYNISPKGGHGTKGCFSEETISKIRNSQKGKSKLLYFIEKYGEIEGKIFYDNWIFKLKQKCSGWHHTEENKKIIGEKGIGRFCSEERKRKIGEANKINSIGNKSHFGFTHTEETKQIIRNKKLGFKLSEEIKFKISQANKGKKHGK